MKMARTKQALVVAKCLILATSCLLIRNNITAEVLFQPLHSFGNVGPRTPLIQSADGNLYGTAPTGGTYGFGSVFRLTLNGTFTTVYSFTGAGDGGGPDSLIQVRDGNLYGSTLTGGVAGFGALFRMSTSGQLITIYSFTVPKNHTEFPGGFTQTSGLVQASDGNLYGTTPRGGANFNGMAFRITTNGVFTLLHSFAGGSEGTGPNATLIQASDGNLYGTTAGGGTDGQGTIFQMALDGTFTTLYSFSGGTDGAVPGAGLIQASDGNLYGTTREGAAFNGAGTVFQISTNGDFATIYSFSDGYSGSLASLIQAPDSNLYGTSAYGGGTHAGMVFRMTTDGNLTSLYSLTSATDGFYPLSLSLGADGNLYGSTLGGLSGPPAGTLFRITTNGLFTSVYSFPYQGDGGSQTLVPARDGALYGTTPSGGTNNNGTVFQFLPNGSYATLYSFSGGWPPPVPTALIEASDGNFYGTTSQGGGIDSGTVFRVTTNGTLTTLYSLDGTNTVYPNDGSQVNSLIQARDGNFYGTAAAGGNRGFGTVFRITTNGAFTLLHAFNGTDGYVPNGLVQASDGNLYGTCQLTLLYSGNVFRISTNGAFSVLRTFTSTSQGTSPAAGLIQASDGNLYGTTSGGGIYDWGTIFRITPSGAFTRLYSFSGASDGGGPRATLLQATDGKLYGVTSTGGGDCPIQSSCGYGTLFRITTNGTFTVLYSFRPDFAAPYGLVQAADGNLYGSTGVGAVGAGALFRILLSAPAAALSIFSDGSSGYFINARGQPNFGYQLLRAPDLTGPWSTNASQTADTSGFIQFHDSVPPPDRAFYRTMQQ